MDLTGAGESKGDGLGVVWRTAGWRVSSEAAVAATLGRVQLGVLGAAQMGPGQSRLRSQHAVVRSDGMKR